MLRRLTERHKCHAIQLLTGSSTFRGTLYGLPHRDGLVNSFKMFVCYILNYYFSPNLSVALQKSQPGWPNNEAIEQCKNMG